METILNQIIRGMSSIPYLSNLFVRLDLPKKYLPSSAFWPFEANTKQSLELRELGLKNDNLIAVIRRKISLGKSEKHLEMKLTTFEKHRIVTFYSLERGLLQDPSQKKT